MKSFVRLCILLCLLPVYTICAQEEDEPGDQMASLSRAKKEVLSLSRKSPPISLVITPQQNNAITYLPLPGFTSADPESGQVSVGFYVINEGTAPLVWEKVTYGYSYQSTKETRSFQTNGSKGLRIQPTGSAYWQNKRGYHEAGEVLYFTAPLPDELTIELYFTGFSKPIRVVKKLVPFTTSFRLPFKEEDLEPGECISTGATHGGKAQVFAYDIGIVGSIGQRRSLTPRKNPASEDSNANVRVYGKRVYAISDGEVIDFEDDQPDNSKPGARDSKEANRVRIRYQDMIIIYAHLKPHSLNPAIKKIGAQVKAGDFLGQAGNSGTHSSGPHLHLSIKGLNGELVPLVFSNGYVLGQKQFTNTTPASAWTPLGGRGIPGFEKERSLVWPGEKPPGN
jgi:hypothetical protein